MEHLQSIIERQDNSMQIINNMYLKPFHQFIHSIPQEKVSLAMLTRHLRLTKVMEVTREMMKMEQWVCNWYKGLVLLGKKVMCQIGDEPVDVKAVHKQIHTVIEDVRQHTYIIEHVWPVPVGIPDYRYDFELKIATLHDHTESILANLRELFLLLQRDEVDMDEQWYTKDHKGKINVPRIDELMEIMPPKYILARTQACF